MRFTPWQELDLEAHGLTYEAVTSAVQWLSPRTTPDTQVPSGAAAVGRLLLRSRWPFRPIGALMLIPPFSWLAAAGYRLVARNRYRLPGSTPACAVPAQAAASPAAAPASAQGAGDLGGGPDHARTGAVGVELAEGDHAD